MKYILDHLYLDVDTDPRTLRGVISKRLGIPERNFHFEVLDREFVQEGLKRGILYKVGIDTIDFVSDTTIHFLPEVDSFGIPSYPFKDRPVVIGAGIAGLFAAYVLALSGARPILLEKGLGLNERRRNYEAFEIQGRLEGLDAGRYGIGGYLATTGFRLSKEGDSLKERWLFETIESLGVTLPKDHHIFLSPSQVAALCSALLAKIATMGGEIHTEATVTSVRSLLGKVREVRYVKGGNEQSVSSSHVLVCAGENNLSLLSKAGANLGQESLAAISFFVEKPLSELCRPLYGSAAPDPRLPMSFSASEMDLDGDIHAVLAHFYPYASAVSMAAFPSEVNLGLAFGKKEEQNGITVVHVLPKKGAVSKEEVGDFVSKPFRSDQPFACPAETVKDYLLGKDPLRLGTFRPSYGKGVYLANLDYLFGGKVGQGLHKALEALMRKEAVFADGRGLLFGPSLTFINGSSSPLAKDGKTNVKGLYFAAPVKNYDYSGRLVASAGIEAALALLNGK